MDTLQNMHTFVAVAEFGAFSGAAKKTQIGVATASRNIRNLETRLHTRLPNRTPRQVALTEAGLRYLRRCEQIIAESAVRKQKSRAPMPAPETFYASIPGLGREPTFSSLP